jgi:hypothetical protein
MTPPHTEDLLTRRLAECETLRRQSGHRERTAQVTNAILADKVATCEQANSRKHDDLAVKRARIKDLEKQLEEGRKRNEPSAIEAKHNAEINALEMKRKNAVQESRRLREELEKCGKGRDELGVDLEKEKIRNQELQHEYARRLERQREVAGERVKVLEEELVKAKSEVERLEGEVKRLRRK